MNEYQILAFVVVPIVMAVGGSIMALWFGRDPDRRPTK